MRTKLLNYMLIPGLALLVTSGAGARVADSPASASPRLERQRIAPYAVARTRLEVAQTTDPLVAEGERIDLQSAAAKDWPQINETEDAFESWYEKLLLERQTRNDPEYLKQREQSIANELASAKNIRMEIDVKVCRGAGIIEAEIEFLRAPILRGQQAIAVAWNKQFAANELREFAYALNRCWEWQGKVSSLFAANGVDYNLELNVVFRPVRDGQIGLVTYSMTVLDQLGLGLNQPSGRCQSKLIGQTTIAQGVILRVGFGDFADGKLSYFGLGSSIINTTFECDGKSVPQGFPLIWLFTSTDGQLSKAAFISNPNNRRIQGSVSSKGMTATWDLQRQAPKN